MMDAHCLCGLDPATSTMCFPEYAVLDRVDDE